MVTRAAPPTRANFAHWRKVTTRWADNDVYGHVNNVVHYQWFDSAVNGWLIEQGLLDISVGEPIALVVETSCRYFASLSFPEDVDVGVRIAHVGTSSVRYAIGIFAAGAQYAAASGEFVHVAVDRRDRRPTPWPDHWRNAFAAIS